MLSFTNPIPIELLAFIHPRARASCELQNVKGGGGLRPPLLGLGGPDQPSSSPSQISETLNFFAEVPRGRGVPP